MNDCLKLCMYTWDISSFFCLETQLKGAEGTKAQINPPSHPPLLNSDPRAIISALSKGSSHRAESSAWKHVNIMKLCELSCRKAVHL